MESFMLAVIFQSVVIQKRLLKKLGLNVHFATKAKSLKENQRKIEFSTVVIDTQIVNSFHGINRLDEIVQNAIISWLKRKSKAENKSFVQMVIMKKPYKNKLKGN